MQKSWKSNYIYIDMYIKKKKTTDNKSNKNKITCQKIWELSIVWFCWTWEFSNLDMSKWEFRKKHKNNNREMDHNKKQHTNNNEKM